MKIELRPACLHDLHFVARRLRTIDKRELAVTRNVGNWRKLAQDAMRDQVYGQVAYLNSLPVFAFGATRVNQDVVQVWAFGTDYAGPALNAVTRHVKRVMIPYLLEHGVRAAGAVSHPANTQAHCWLQYLGFTLKATIGVGSRHEAMRLYAVTADELPQPH